MVTFLEQYLQYPPSVSFCFEGFNEVKYSKQLTAYLIDRASTSDGTRLVTSINREYVSKKKQFVGDITLV